MKNKDILTNNDGSNDHLCDVNLRQTSAFDQLNQYENDYDGFHSANNDLYSHSLKQFPQINSWHPMGFSLYS